MKRCPSKINYWETENLTGCLRVWKENCSAPAVCSYEFKMPTKNAVGRKAKEHILNAAGCVGFIDISFRCVKHSVVCSVTSRVMQTERFSFRRSDLPDIRYDIELREDMDSCEGIGFTGGFEEEYPKKLKTIKKKRIDNISFRFCDAGRYLSKIRKMTDIRYLSILDCYTGKPFFQEIGHLDELRGLWLYGWTMSKLDLEAMGELQKLKKLEALSIFNDFPVSANALSELGKLKSLKALELQLEHVNLGKYQKDRVEKLSFLGELENLEVLVLRLDPRLSPCKLSLPQNLKYLEINHTVYPLPIRPEKSSITK